MHAHVCAVQKWHMSFVIYNQSHFEVESLRPLLYHRMTCEVQKIVGEVHRIAKKTKQYAGKGKGKFQRRVGGGLQERAMERSAR